MLLLAISTFRFLIIISEYEKDFNNPYNVRLFMFFASITAMTSFLFRLHFWKLMCEFPIQLLKHVNGLDII